MIRVHRILAIFLACFVPFLSTLSTSQVIPENTYQELRWRMIGPFRGGRTRAVSGVPSQPNVFYVGAVNGGVWKSNDYGRTWNPIFDDQPTQSIGAIAVAPSDPNIVYVGSGEGLHRPDLSVGNGIYKSTDAGKTWTHLGLQNGMQIPALAVDPHDPNKLFAAVLGRPYGPSEERGIYRSADGGQSWQNVLHKDANTGGSDVEIDPSNPNIIYASLWEIREGPWEDNNQFQGSGGGLFKSTDGGTTWRQLKGGLPDNLSQINVAIAPSQPNRLYAAFSTTAKAEYGSGAGLGFYRSDDGGETWNRPGEDPRASFKIGGGDLPIPRVDPQNPDVVYSTSIVTFRSNDAGKTWTGIRGAPGGDDYQNIWINPNNPKIILLVSDQGAVVSVNGGESWSSWYNQPTAQLYHVAVTNTFPYKLCSGQQESGSVCISSRGNDGAITYREWHPVGVIEYGYAAPDPLDPDIIYGAGRTEVSKFHWSTGQVQNITPIPVRDPKYRADRTEPIMFSPIDPHTLYYASNYLFKTTDGGQHWETISPDLTRTDPGTPASVGDFISKNPDAAKQRGVIYSLAPSFKNIHTIWAGTDDGQLWSTRDGGKNWSNLTPNDMTPWRKVTQIQASHFDDNSAYVSASGFRIDDLHPYIYRTHDAGKSWQLITHGLPDSPVDVVREDPERKGLLFAGTETGVWVSFDDGENWQSLQLNLPHTSMRDLWIHENDLIVATHGRGFWILDAITLLRQVNASFATADATLFKPGMAYRVRRDTYTDTPVPPDEPAAQNPPDGAVIDYYLAKPAEGALRLEILDAAGKAVRSYASTDPPAATEESLKKQLIPLYWIRMPRALGTDAGHHRWVWDLRYAEPVSTEHEYPISAVPHDTPRLPQGPLALPGQYTVRLSVNGKTYTAPLTVKMDPRVKITPAALSQLFSLESRLSSMLSDSSTAVLQAQAVRSQLDKLKSQASGSVADAVKTAGEELTAIYDQTGKPGAAPANTLKRLNGNASALYFAIGQSDAQPTTVQVETTDTLGRDLPAALKSWSDFKQNVLAKLNQQLQAAHLPQVQADAVSENGADGEDME
ncbi:MAG TPA: glycoside hydrolase [Terriglobales bacterium]|nr:glycoside hydrolase [Terriglobales bacterium]